MQSGEGAVFVRFVLIRPSRFVRFSLHNLDYLEKQGGICGGFEIIQRKLCKSKMIKRGVVSRAKVDKGGTGWEIYWVGGWVYFSSSFLANEVEQLTSGASAASDFQMAVVLRSERIF